MSIYDRGAYLRSMTLLREEVPSFGRYPFHLPVVAAMDRLDFHPKVTYIIGENGMGKSTLLEAVAVALGFNAEGGTLNFNFSTAETHSELYRYLRPVRGAQRVRDGFFFRAESYYNLATQIDALDREPGFTPPIINSYGGKSLHMMSHGESFFATFMNRFGGRGLYILDEPEAALSPYRQMAMLSRIHELVKQHSQFIISTHSPILMAYPDSKIYQLTSEGMQEVTLEETDHYVIMKEFLNNRERMLGELFNPE
ncbi:AAA family ATPase [Paenibacillus motobuensis]|uniref:AAA family ATPase n=1 Tax=Paenibacillus TaxID=44249 RepID=UPI00203E78DE|nr:MULTISPECIES: AAA family ATPase [Paenibacillus]MCM3042930.1 AAA family ATPase [Paenibacillus lutimineralis]MCM3650034.1 AAA family ATPase [Paenibacillus motobuensis]